MCHILAKQITLASIIKTNETAGHGELNSNSEHLQRKTRMPEVAN
jgi:hypothetical protein